MELEKLAKDTVENYYSMSEEQRNFILDIIDKSEISWTRQQLMKALILYNKSKENNCSIHDSKLDQYVDIIDSNGTQLNFLLKQFDDQYRNLVGVTW